jgi:hypothetical protein
MTFPKLFYDENYFTPKQMENKKRTDFHEHIDHATLPSGLCLEAALS